jgi:parallel beta-helix repeat protein
MQKPGRDTRGRALSVIKKAQAMAHAVDCAFFVTKLKPTNSIPRIKGTMFAFVSLLIIPLGMLLVGFKDKNFKVKFTGLLLFILLALTFLPLTNHSSPLTGKAQAATADTLNFQGRLLTSTGALVPDGDYHIEFKLYNQAAPDGGETPIQGSCLTNPGAVADENCLWTETRSTGNLVTIQNGYFSVYLGDVTAFGALDWDQDMYLGMNVGGSSGSASWDGEMSPRFKLTSVPYAFNANRLVATDSGFKSVLSLATPTANRTITAPDESGTICLTSGNCAGVGGTGDILDGGQTGAISIGTTNNTTVSLLQNNTAALTVNTSQLLQFNAYNCSTFSNGGTLTTDASGNVICANDDGGGGGTGVDTVGALDGGTPNANGATISGTTIYLQSASASNAGLVNTTTQTFAGNKTFNGNLVVAANQSLTLTGGNTASRPGSPTEGMVYFDTTTDSLLTYANGKWQQDRTDAVLVAASNSSQSDKDAADYVADGNTGAANDGDQIQINNALTAASGRKVVLLAGTYVADATILIPNNTTLAGVGRGTLIELADIDATDNLIENSDTTTGTGVVIQDLRLDGRNDLNTAGTQKGILLSGIGSGSARQGGKVINTFVSRFREVGIQFTNVQNSIISGNEVSNIAGVSGWAGINTISSYNITVVNNIMAYNTSGIRLTASWNIAMSGNSIYGNSEHGIFANALFTSSISANSIAANSLSGIYVPASYNNVISSNGIHDNGGTTSNNGIRITTDSDFNSITNNVITDTACTTSCFAINIDAVASDKNYLEGNRFTGSAANAATINDAGTNTIYVNQQTNSTTSTLSDVTDFTFRGSANSTTAFAVQNASGGSILTVDTTNAEVEVGNSTTAGKLVISDGSSNYGTILVASTAGDYTYTIPTTTANDTFCLVGLNNCTGSGATSVGALDGGTLNANGGNIAAGVLYLQSASATYPGLITTGAQTIAGAKTFSGAVTVGGNLTVDTNVLVVDASTNRVGVGGTAIVSKFAVFAGNLSSSTGSFYSEATFTAGASSFPSNQWLNTTVNPSGAATNAEYASGYSELLTSGSNLQPSSSVFGYDSYGELNHTSTLGLYTGYSSRTYVFDGTTTLLEGFRSRLGGVDSGSTVSTFRGVGVYNPTSVSGTLTNNIGFYTENQTAGTNNTNLAIGGSTTGNWSIYNASTYANLFGGSLTVDAQITSGDAGTAGSLRASDGSSNYITLDVDAQSNDYSISVPTLGANDEICLLVLGNCSGGTGSDEFITVAANDSPAAKKIAADYTADGTADEVQIQAAIDALPASGGTVYLLEGTFNIDDTVNLGANDRLVGTGNGTILFLVASQPNDTEIVNIGANSEISSLKIDGNKSNQTGTELDGIIVDGASALIENVLVVDIEDLGIRVTSNGDYTLISDVEVRDTDNNGISLYFGAENVQVSDSYIESTGNTTDVGITTNYSNEGVRLLNNQVEGYNVGIQVQDEVTVRGNVIHSSNTQGIVVDGARATISDNIIHSNGGNGVFINGFAGAYVLVSDNTIYGNSFDGISISGAPNNTIANNNIYDNGDDGIALYNANADNNQIIGNRITDTAGTSYGILINDATNESTYMADNVIDGTFTSQILDNGTGTIYANQLDNNNDLRLGSNNQLYVRNTTNATDAFQIQNAAGASLFNVDTTNTRINLQAGVEASGYINSPYGGFGNISNMIDISEEFNNASWTKSNVTVTANSTVAPNGQTTADTLTSTAAGGSVYDTTIYSTPTTFTFSVWVKTASGTQPFSLQIDAPSGTPATGTAASFTATTTWQRYSVTQTVTGSPTTYNARITITNDASSILAWGAQMVPGTSPGAYFKSVNHESYWNPNDIGLAVSGRLNVSDGIYLGNGDANSFTSLTSGSLRAGGTTGLTLSTAYDYDIFLQAGSSGSVVFDGMTTDITTDTNEDLTISPNGTGVLAVTSASTFTGLATFNGNLRVSDGSSNYITLDVDAQSNDYSISVPTLGANDEICLLVLGNCSGLSSTLLDNTADIWDIQEGTNNYINIRTTNGNEDIVFGNTTTSPSIEILSNAKPSNQESILNLTGNLTYNTASASEAQYGIRYNGTVQPTGASSGYYYGALFSPNANGAFLSGTSVVGVRGDGRSQSTGTLTTAIGGMFNVQNTGSGTITNGRGLLISDFINSGGGAISNRAGIVVDEITAGTNTTNVIIGTTNNPAGAFSIYNSSTRDNVFAGNLRVGSTTAPTVALDVTGAALISTTLGVTGLTTLNGGLTVEAGDTFTFNTDGFTDFTGGGLVNSGGVLSVDTTSATGFFQNGGNNFGGNATIGTNGASQTLALETGGTTRFTVSGTASTVTGNGATTIAGGSTLTLSSATTSALNIDSGTTGAISIGANTSAKTINLGTGGTGVKTINIGGTAANIIGIGNTQTAGTVNIGAAMTTGTITIGGTGLQTGTIALGTGTGAQTINLGTGGTGAKTVTLGSTASTGTTTIQAGSGGISLNTNTTLAAGQYLRVTGGITASRPGTPTEGMVYFDTTTDSLLTYANGKWQSDRGEYVVVAANDSTQAAKDRADYVGDGESGDGLTTLDGDQVQLNSAISAVNATGGGTVFLMEGTYVLDDEVSLLSNVKIIGSGQTTILTFPNGLNSGVSLVLLEDKTASVSGVEVRNLKLNGNGANVTAALEHTGIKFDDGTATNFGIKVDNITAVGFQEYGVNLWGGTNNFVTNSTFDGENLSSSNLGITIWSSYSTVSGNTISRVGLGISESSTETYNNISNNRITDLNGGTYSAIDAGGDFTVVSGNIIELNTNAEGISARGINQSIIGNTITGGDYGINTVNATSPTISTNTINSSIDGIFINNTDRGTISGNVISNTTDNGIEIVGGSDDWVVDGNAVSNSAGYGIYLGNSNINRTLVSNNNLYNNGASTSRSSIIIGASGAASDTSVTDNRITDTAGTGYAIDITSFATNTNLSGNVYSGTGATTINDAGTGTIYANQATTAGGLNITFRQTNSTTAFAVQNASGGSILNIDTQNGGLEVGDSITQGNLKLSDGSSNFVTINVDPLAFSYTLSIPTITANDEFCLVNLANCGGGGLSGTLTDNTADAWDIQEGTNNYININTTNGSENISFGNATTNPSYNFLSSSSTTFAGNLNVTRSSAGIAAISTNASAGTCTFGTVQAYIYAENSLGGYSELGATRGACSRLSLYSTGANRTAIFFGNNSGSNKALDFIDTDNNTLLTISDAGTTANLFVTGNADFYGGTLYVGDTSVAGSLEISDGSSNYGTIAVEATAGNYTYTIPTTTANDEFCLVNLANCGGGGTGSDEIITVAANDTPAAQKAAADYVADGTSDETEINSALTAAAGGKVELLAGTFVIDGTILIPNNTTLAGTGNGTVIELADIDATDNLIENSDTSTGTGVVIRDLKLDGRSDLNTVGFQTGIRITGMGEYTPTPVLGVTISNTIVDDFNSSGISFSSTNNSNVFGNTIIDSSFSVTSSSSNIFANNELYASYMNFAAGSDSNSIVNNFIRDSPFYGIQMSNNTGNIVDNNHIINIGDSWDAISLSTVTRAIISNNKLENSGGASTNDAIYLITSDYNSITNNLITDASCTSSCRAINISGATSDKNYLEGNRFSGSAANAATINDAGTGTIYAGQQTNSTTSTNSDVSDFRFRGSANSTTAFAVQNASGTSVLNVNTTTAGVTVGGTLTVDSTSTFTGLSTFNGGLTVEAGDTFTFNTDIFTDFTGGGLVNTGGVLTVDATSATGFFQNGGNIFAGGTATLGTNDGNSLVFETNNQSAITIASGGATTFQNATDSPDALRVLTQAGSEVLSVDTLGVLGVDIGGSLQWNSNVITDNYLIQINGTELQSTNNSSQYGVQLEPAFDLSTVTGGNLANLYSMLNLASISVAPSGTISNAYGQFARIDNTANADITNIYGLYVSDSTGSGQDNNYGIYVDDMNQGSSSDYGIVIAGADTQALWVGSGANNTDAANGIAFGSSRDTNLYRSAANVLRTDDALSIGGTLTVANITPTVNLTIGTSNTTGTLLVLDTKTNAGDPTGVNGAMYYNSNDGKFRCYENAAWKDCIATSLGVTTTITRVPEYEGGTIYADGSNNSGTLTSGFASGLSAGEGYKHTYYQWTTSQATAQDYNIVVNVPIPSDFTGSFSSISFWHSDPDGATTNSEVTLTITDHDGTSCSSASYNGASAGVWEQETVSLAGCTYSADDILTFNFNVKTTSGAGSLRLGEFKYQYVN